MGERGRSVLYLMGSVYLLHLAITMRKGLAELAGMDYILTMLFAILFALVGVGLLSFAVCINVRLYRSGKKKSEEEHDSTGDR